MILYKFRLNCELIEFNLKITINFEGIEDRYVGHIQSFS